MKMPLEDALAWLDPAPGEVAQYIDANDLKQAIIQVYEDLDDGVAGASAEEVAVQPGTPTTGIELWVDTDDEYTSTVGMPQRNESSIFTASIPPGQTYNGMFNLASSYRLYKFWSNGPCRVRLYTTYLKMQADASRPTTTPPTGDHGLAFEFVATPNLMTSDILPAVDGYDGDEPPDGQIPIAITNTAGYSQTLSVNFIWIRTE